MLVLLERDLSSAQPLVQLGNGIGHRRGGVRDRRVIADERRVNLLRRYKDDTGHPGQADEAELRGFHPCGDQCKGLVRFGLKLMMP